MPLSEPITGVNGTEDQLEMPLAHRDAMVNEREESNVLCSGTELLRNLVDAIFEVV